MCSISACRPCARHTDGGRSGPAERPNRRCPRAVPRPPRLLGADEPDPDARPRPGPVPSRPGEARSARRTGGVPRATSVTTDKQWADIVSLARHRRPKPCRCRSACSRSGWPAKPSTTNPATWKAKPSRPEDEDEPADRFALCWQGPEKSTAISDPKEVRPNSVYVIPCSAPDVSSLGDFIGTCLPTTREEAFQRSRDKALLRLPDSEHPRRRRASRRATW